MKKLIGSFLFLLTGTIFSVSIEKGITFEKEDISIHYDFCNKYLTSMFGTPYCLTIKNKKDKSIMVDPSLIGEPLIMNYQAIALAWRGEFKFTLIQFSFVAALISGAYYLGDYDARQSPFITATGVTLLGSFAAFCLYKLSTQNQTNMEHSLKKEMFLESEIVEPGQEVKKLFWRNDDDILNRLTLEINFDKIQVL